MASFFSWTSLTEHQILAEFLCSDMSTLDHFFDCFMFNTFLFEARDNNLWNPTTISGIATLDLPQNKASVAQHNCKMDEKWTENQQDVAEQGIVITNVDDLANKAHHDGGNQNICLVMSIGQFVGDALVMAQECLLSGILIVPWLLE
ncbi:hypothetical protein HD554DRAFT_2038315 [Boletus coccyginus]|nr:hypothetical protein HD554DRAFT_2038315 [Boletus coccyginus]